MDYKKLIFEKNKFEFFLAFVTPMVPQSYLIKKNQQIRSNRLASYSQHEFITMSEELYYIGLGNPTLTENLKCPLLNQASQLRIFKHS